MVSGSHQYWGQGEPGWRATFVGRHFQPLSVLLIYRTRFLRIAPAADTDRKKTLPGLRALSSTRAASETLQVLSPVTIFKPPPLVISVTCFVTDSRLSLYSERIMNVWFLPSVLLERKTQGLPIQMQGVLLIRDEARVPVNIFNSGVWTANQHRERPEPYLSKVT